MKPKKIRLAEGDALCVAENDVKLLKSHCTLIEATLLGLDFQQRKKFALILVGGAIHLADTVTGTIYGADGRHHTSRCVRVVNLPDMPSSIASVEAEEVAA